MGGEENLNEDVGGKGGGSIEMKTWTEREKSLYHSSCVSSVKEVYECYYFDCFFRVTVAGVFSFVLEEENDTGSKRS